MIIRFLLSLHLLNVLAFAFWGPLFSAYATSLGASPSAAGSLYAFYTLLHAVAIFSFGYIDRPSNRIPLLVSGYCVQGICAILFITTNQPTMLFLPLGLSAVGGGMIAPAWKAFYTKSVHEGKEGKQWSFYDAGTMFAVAGGAFFAGLLASNFGYNAIFIPLLLLNVLAIILTISKRSTLSRLGG